MARGEDAASTLWWRPVRCAGCGGVGSRWLIAALGRRKEVAAMSAQPPAGREDARQAEDRSALYDRLGGVYAIAVVVDDFIDRVMNDARLNANPRVDAAHHRV